MEGLLMTHVYVVGTCTGWFHLQSVVDTFAFYAPTLFRWRVYGGDPPLPNGWITGDQLAEWVGWVQSHGLTIRSIPPR